MGVWVGWHINNVERKIVSFAEEIQRQQGLCSQRDRSRRLPWRWLSHTHKFGKPTPVTGFVQLVADRRAVTLLPIIQVHVQPGTVIHSSHGTVNHSTLNWNRIKIKLKRMRGGDRKPAAITSWRVHVERATVNSSIKASCLYPNNGWHRHMHSILPKPNQSTSSIHPSIHNL